MKGIRELLRNERALRVAALLVVVSLLVPSTVSALTHTHTSLRPGTIDDAANGTTVISVQGFRIGNVTNPNKPARLVGVDADGDLKWVHTGGDHDILWFYDVDPLESGNLLVTGTVPGETVVYSWNPETSEVAWTERFDMEDTHDVDLVNGDQLLIGNLRNYDESTGKNDDRIALYDRSRDEFVWEWKFRREYDRSSGGEYTDDWTHVNDVDEVGPGRYMASPRNMDEVIVVNRSTKDVEMRLGSDQNHSVLYAQHNPDYLVSENGTPTVLVADSENDRVAEYARTGDGWTRTWTLGSNESLNWPRDADRLPNGNTLVVDTLNHRVFEATPTGRIVWEYYAAWGPYDAERVVWGDSSEGPTARELNATGHHEITGSANATAGLGPNRTFSGWVADAFADTPVEPEAEWAASRWAHVTPWLRPVWMGSWDFAFAVAAGVVALVWGGAELFARRGRLVERARRVEGRRRRN